MSKQNLPRVQVNIGSTRAFAGDEFPEHARILLMDEASASNEKIKIDVQDWRAIPLASLQQLIVSAHELRSLRNVEVVVNGRSFNSIVEASIENIAAPRDLTAHGNTLNAAKHAAGLNPDAIDGASGLIAARLQKLGVKTTASKLAREIRTVSGINIAQVGNSSRNSGPKEIAALFLAQQDRGRLVYSRDDFYQFKPQGWQKVRSMKVQVAKFINTVLGLDATDCLTRDVVLNLQATTDVPNDPELPFSLSEPEKSCNRVAFRNGVLDVDHFISSGEAVLTEVLDDWVDLAPVPYNFDPDATCPRWLEALNQWFPKIEDGDCRIDVAQEAFGYALLNDCRFEKMIVLLGQGANGKSVFLRVLEAMLGPQSVSHAAYHELSARFGLNPLRGKRANISAELSHVGKANEAVLKQLISGEMINVDRKHQPSIDVVFFTKMFFAANVLPNFSDWTNGIWRRQLYIPFLQRFDEGDRDVNLAASLISESSGIINWALAGLRRLIAQGGFTRCSVCERVLNEHHTDSDIVRTFLDRYVRRQPGVRTQQSVLCLLFRFVVTLSGRKPVNDGELLKRLAALEFEVTRPGGEGTRPRYFRDLQLVVEDKVVFNMFKAKHAEVRSLSESTPAPGNCTDVDVATP